MKSQDLQDTFSQLASKVEHIYQEIEHLHFDLQFSIKEIRDKYMRDIIRNPVPITSHYWNIYGEYWHSFVLFGEKLKIAEEQLLASKSNSLLSLSTNETTDLEIRIDQLDDLLDSLEPRKECQTKLMIFFELIDTTERLRQLRIPKNRNKSSRFANAFYRVKNETIEIQNQLEQVLASHEVNKLGIVINEYPPPEITRIIKRLDQNRDDDIVIVQVVTNGYAWRNKIVRKADVIVKSKQGEAKDG